MCVDALGLTVTFFLFLFFVFFSGGGEGGRLSFRFHYASQIADW